MYIALQTKIMLTVLLTVALFTFFTLFYFPSEQRRYLLKSYNNEVQNLANTVALGVRISLNEQNYEGVQTAMEFVKGNPNLRFVSLVEYDTTWNDNHTRYKINESVFNTYPEKVKPQLTVAANDSMIVKRSSFRTAAMSGAIVLGFSTAPINQSQKEILRTSVLISSGIFLLGLLIAVWVSKNLSAPVIALRNAARRIAKGDLTPVLYNFSNDEIGDLAKAFNSMVEDLATSREELRDANRELSKTNITLSAALEDLKTTQAQLIQSEKMASLGELTAGIAHEIQNPLNFINNFSEVNTELMEEMEAVMKQGNTSEVLELVEVVKDNLRKVTYHGKRADSIVKNMLQHSRKSSGQKEPININNIVDEYLRLSYHGIRAQDKSFNAILETHLDPTINTILAIPQDLGRVLLNLFNNAFYSVNQKKKMLQNEAYEPLVTVRTSQQKTAVEILIEDNGIGISQSILDKIYQPFFTTKPSGQGTGLGLSLSYEIITKVHGGSMWVETEEGQFARFKIILPASTN